MKKYLEIGFIMDSEEEKMELGKKIHEELVGNQDYIDCKIVLNIDDPLTVKLSVMEDAKELPDLDFLKAETT